MSPQGIDSFPLRISLAWLSEMLAEISYHLLLFVAQGYQGIDARGAARGDVAGGQRKRNNNNHARDAGNGKRVERAHAE